MRKGFTLIELLVITAIIVILTALIFSNYRGGSKQLALQRTSSRLAQDLRKTQEMAMSAKEVSGAVPYGFGIYLSSGSPSSYIIFADLDNSHNRNVGDRDLETVNLESNIRITSLSPASSFSIVFNPPDPTVWINNSSSGVTAQIIFGILNEPGSSQTVSVNSAGLINLSGAETDQCNLDSNCDDGNFCTNDWCENPSQPDSVCRHDPVANGIDCGNCRQCQSGVCSYLCGGSEASCCAAGIDSCRDCSSYYGEACDYGTCTSDQKPSWSCSDGDCSYSCYSDASCSTCSLSSSSCSSPESSISCGGALNGCLNAGDFKYFSVPGSSGRNVTVSVTYSGTGCYVNDLYIHSSACGTLAIIDNTNWTKTWTGVPASDIKIGLDGDSSNINCLWDLSVTCP